MLSKAELPQLCSAAVADMAVTTSRISTPEGDGQLVLRARQGDSWAEEALYRRHVREVTRVVTRLLRRSEEAEDVVQDTFVRALTDLGQLDKPDAFRSWLLRIAVHQVHRRFRRRRLLRLFGLDQGVDDMTLTAQLDPGASPELRATLREVDRLLGTLPASPRVAWVLRYVEGRTVDDVAEHMATSRSTVKRFLARAEALLQDHLADSRSEP
jgi:RNA polymerase sigma-70 factor (ECF subfamily)